MKKHFDKILLERPRVGHADGESSSRHARRTFKKELAQDGCEGENYANYNKVESMTSHVRNHPKRRAKSFNKNLKPLRRFLLSCVGRPWDSVYSEIMNNINLKNSSQYHVWEHLILLGEVKVKTYMEGDTVMAGGLIGPENLTKNSYDISGTFYVDPRNGILCCTEPKKRNKLSGITHQKHETNNLDNYRYIDKKNHLVQFHMIDGVWYEYQMRIATEKEACMKSFGENVKKFDSINLKWNYKWEKMEENKFASQIFSDRGMTIIPYNYTFWTACKSIFGGTYLPVSKRQINSREVKKIEGFMLHQRLRKKAA